jgi:hypothetical protein
VNVCILSDKVKILDLLKGGMFLVEVGWYGRNESNIPSTVLNSMSMHPEFCVFSSTALSLESYNQYRVYYIELIPFLSCTITFFCLGFWTCGWTLFLGTPKSQDPSCLGLRQQLLFLTLH